MEPTEKVKCIQTDSNNNQHVRYITFQKTKDAQFMNKHNLIYQNGEAPTKTTETEEAPKAQKVTEKLNMSLKATSRNGEILTFENKGGDKLTLDFTGMKFGESITQLEVGDDKPVANKMVEKATAPIKKGDTIENGKGKIQKTKKKQPIKT